jgi:hypothetical protein
MNQKILHRIQRLEMAILPEHQSRLYVVEQWYGESPEAALARATHLPADLSARDVVVLIIRYDGPEPAAAGPEPLDVVIARYEGPEAAA